MAAQAGLRMVMPVQMPLANIKPRIAPIPGCPEGLEYLCFVDQLLVHQHLQLIELFVSYDERNKYVVKNTMGQFVFLALEESGEFQRCCCGLRRAFEMKLMDYRNVEVLRFIRPLRCGCACCGCACCVCSCCCCCLQEMHVYATKDGLLGSIKFQCNPIFPTFFVLDSNKRVVLQIQGPFLTCGCCNDVVFDIFTKGGTKVGFISQNWTGELREILKDIDNFTVVFPLDLDVKVKAVLLGALILIDFMFFESGSGRRGSAADRLRALLG